MDPPHLDDIHVPDWALTRENWLKVLRQGVEPGCDIGTEARGGAHQLQEHGFKVRLVAPQFVKPYVKSNKNDANEAEAICETMGWPHIGFVSVKSIEQQDIQAAHRVRAELIKQRTAKANQIRGLVAEYGLVAPKKLELLRRPLPCWLEDAENGLSGRFRRLLHGLRSDLQALDERVSELDREITMIVTRGAPVDNCSARDTIDRYPRLQVVHRRLVAS